MAAAHNPWKPILSAPKPGVPVRLKGFAADKQASAIGLWNDHLKIWVDRANELPLGEPTYWKKCRYTKMDSKRSFKHG